jgi:hypothetical protein
VFASAVSVTLEDPCWYFRSHVNSPVRAEAALTKRDPALYGIHIPDVKDYVPARLQFCPTDPSETELMARFAKIGVGAGQTFDASKLSSEMKAAIEQGIADAWADLANLKKQVEGGKVTRASRRRSTSTHTSSTPRIGARWNWSKSGCSPNWTQMVPN